MDALGGWGHPEFVAAAGTRVHAAVLGPAGAPGLVCVHGLGVSHRYFGPVARQLSGSYRVTAVDLPGFGRTRGPHEPLDVRGLSRALAEWLRADASPLCEFLISLVAGSLTMPLQEVGIG